MISLITSSTTDTRYIVLGTLYLGGFPKMLFFHLGGNLDFIRADFVQMSDTPQESRC